MAARLNHPSIVHIYDIVETDDGDWIVMELVEGRPSIACLRDGLPSACAPPARREIADGLAEAHASNIVHRDLKASNVMVTAAGRAKILDFGLAKTYRGGGEQDLSGPGRGARHLPCDVARAGARPGHRSSLRSVLARLAALRDGDRHLAVPRRDRRRDADPHLHLPAAGRPRRRSRHPARAGGADAPAPEQGAGAPAAQQPRRRRRARADGTVRRTRARRRGTLPPRSRRRRRSTSGRRRRPAGAPSPSPAPLLSSSERRQLTVLCCEVVDAGSPSLEASQAFDSETLYELMMRLRPLAQKVAQRHEATVGNVVGHRVLVYFGYPQSHEDDARRAVRAALDLIAEAADHLGGAAVPGEQKKPACASASTPAWPSSRPARTCRSRWCSAPRSTWRCGCRRRPRPAPSSSARRRARWCGAGSPPSRWGRCRRSAVWPSPSCPTASARRAGPGTTSASIWRRWSAAPASSISSPTAGSRPAAGWGRRCCSAASPASASRGCCARCGSGGRGLGRGRSAGCRCTARSTPRTRRCTGGHAAPSPAREQPGETHADQLDALLRTSR